MTLDVAAHQPHSSTGPSADARASPRQRKIALAVIVAAFLALRLGILLFSFDALFTPGYELHPMGTLANELLHGMPSLPVFEFHDTHSGGQMLSALLSALLFAVFGASYFTLKLVPVLFALVTLVLVFSFVDRRFGFKPALFAAGLLIFAPASYVDYSSSNYGNHSEVLAFVAFTLFALYGRVVDGDRGGRATFVFGLACGLAVWYALSSLLLLMLYMALWWCAEGLFFLRRSFLPFLAGLAVGTTPFWYVMATFDAPQAEWLGAKFGAQKTGLDLGVASDRFLAFFGKLLPNSPTFYDLGPVAGFQFDHALFAIWALAFLALLWRFRASIAWGARRLVVPHKGRGLRSEDVVIVFLAYPLALAFSYALSNFKIGNWPDFRWAGYRYLLTLFLVLDVLLVLAFVELRRRGWRRIANGFAVVVVAVGALGNAGHPFHVASFAKGTRYDGFFYHQVGRIFQSDRWEGREGDAAKALEGLEPRLRAAVYRGIGTYSALGAVRAQLQEGKPFRIADLLLRWPERYRPFIAQGIGTWCTGRLEPGAKKVGQDVLAQSTLLENGFFVQGYFLSFDLLSTARLRAFVGPNLESLMKRIAPPYDRCAAQGLGLFTGSIVWRDLEEERDLVTGIQKFVASLGDESLRLAYYVGLGLSCEDYFDRPEHYDALARAVVPADRLGYFYVGLGWMLDLVFRDDPRLLQKLPENVKADYLGHVTRGMEWRKATSGFVGR